MNIDKDIKELEFSQQQMRLGNLPSYSQAHYKAIENVLSELDRLNYKLKEKICFEGHSQFKELEKELETYKKIAKRLAKEILLQYPEMFNMVTVNNIEMVIDEARKEVENDE